MAEAKPGAPTPGADVPETDESLFTPGFASDPQPVYQRLRERCPVARNAVTGGIMISRFEDVLWALRHPNVFSSDVSALQIGQERPMIPLQLDPPEQTKYRKLLDPLFSRKRMSALEPDIRARARRLIDAFRDAGECDFNRDFAVPLPSAVFLALLGLPYEDLPAFLDMKDGILRPHAGTIEEAQAAREAAGRRIYGYFESTLDERERAPREDILSWMLSAEVDGHRLTREQILDICYLLLLAGLDTVTATLDCFVAHLARNPAQQQALRTNPRLWDGAIEELLRTETPVTMVVRQVVEDVTLSGVRIPRGENVSLVLGAADSDGNRFEQGERVDFERRPNHHVAFGAGPHRCLGSHLARIELRIALEEFHARTPPYSIAPGAELEYSSGIRQVLALPLVFADAGDGAETR